MSSRLSYIVRDMASCCVCRLSLFGAQASSEGPPTPFQDNVHHRTEGGLVLCTRHYDLVTSLIAKSIPIDRWPSHLVRGIVTHYQTELENHANTIANEQNAAANTQVTKTVPSVTPIFGMSPTVSPVGDSWTNYFFMVPGTRQVTDQSAVNFVRYVQDNVARENEAISHCNAEISRYASLLQQMRSQNAPKFVSCIRCGQSEMPLGTTACVWCGQSQAQRVGEVVPTPCLIEEVDPAGVVSEYADRTTARKVVHTLAELTKRQEEIEKQNEEIRRRGEEFAREERAEPMQSLVSFKNSMNLPQGIATSLGAKLNTALDAANAGKYDATIQQLKTFINEVQAKRDVNYTIPGTTIDRHGPEYCFRRKKSTLRSKAFEGLGGGSGKLRVNVLLHSEPRTFFQIVCAGDERPTNFAFIAPTLDGCTPSP